MIKKLEILDGSIKGTYFGNNLVGQVPLKSLRELEKDEAIKNIRFRGEVCLLKGSPDEEKGVLDKYLVELLSILDSTEILIETIDRTRVEKRIEDLGGIVPDILQTDLIYAKLPLKKIETLAESSLITHIYYNQPIHGTFVLDTIKNYKGGE